MSRIRSLKPEWFSSRSLAKVPLAARVTFAGLWCEADDAGRGVADPKILAGRIWPLDDEVTHLDVEQHLVALAQTNHIDLYLVGEERFYAVVNWLKHQSASMRRGEAKYPAPTDGIPWSEPHDNILHADACKNVQDACGSVLEGRGGEGKGGESEGTVSVTSPLALVEQPPADPDPFDAFWSAYPRKLAKPTARKAWTKATKKATPEEITAAARLYARSVAGKDPTYVAHAATWLNAERWNDAETAMAPPKDRYLNGVLMVEGWQG